MREAVLADTLGVVSCPSCGEALRLDPDFNYVDATLGLWVRTLPASRGIEWAELEPETQLLWLTAYGPMAGAAAQELGASLRPRLVFGWAALREKILCAQHGLDDVALELVKLLALTAQVGQGLGDDSEWRLIGVSEGALFFGVFATDSELLVEEFAVPRGPLEEIRDSPEPWADALALVTGEGLFVDLNRSLFQAA